MPISCACGDCGREYNVADEAAGRQFKCKDCGSVVSVPGASRPASPPPLGGSSSGTSSSRPSSRGTTKKDPFGDFDDDFGSSEEALGGMPTRRTKRRKSSSSSSGGSETLGKVSMWIGIIIWGLGILTVIVSIVTFGSIIENAGAGGRPRPNDEQVGAFMAVGFMTCIYGQCIAPLGTIIGTILGIVSLTQGPEGKTQAIVGIVLNAGLLLIGGGLFLLGFIGAMAR
ncbi:MAG: hypothetical protein R3C01_07780 [Planctomycetaceae bacterium]